MRLQRLSGFTLIELLIVVAIIGVLATIGVPTYRTMVQKAKKSEAKVALGGLFSVETAFSNEYGTYGNVLPKLGFDLEHAASVRIYTVGFPSVTCSGTAIFPGNGALLSQVYPDYFVSATVADTVYPAATLPPACALGTISQGSFLATAAGRLGLDSLADTWTMNQSRQLTNTIDGVAK